MDFNVDKPIFRQIVDMCHRNILEKRWMPGRKIPSVRELAVQLSVNTRTVLSALEVLESEGVIATKRGLGFFLTDNADEIVLNQRRKEFFECKLPQFISEAQALGLDPIQLMQSMQQIK